MEIAGFEIENIEIKLLCFVIVEVIVYLAMSKMVTGALFWLYFVVVTLAVLVGTHLWIDFQSNR